MKYPFVKQNDLKDCGVCSLLMIMRYYGGGVSKEYLRNLTNTTKDGVSAFNLIESATKLGFSAYGAEGSLTDIKKDMLPCIAHTVINKSYNHFVVIYKIDLKKKKILIADPAKGIKKMSLEEFNEISTNKFVFLEPVKKIELIENNKDFVNLIKSFFIINFKKILSIIFLSSIITLLSIFCSFQFQFLMEHVMAYHSFRNLVFAGFLFIAVILIKEASSYQRNIILNHTTHQLDKYLNENVYNHLISLPYLYYRNRTTGELITRINDLSSIRDIISQIIVTLGVDSILTILVLIALFILNAKLTFILVITIILFLIVIILFKNILEKQILLSKEEYSKVNSFLVETLTGIETIKNLNIEKFVKENYLLSYCKYNRRSYIYNKVFIVEEFLKNTIDQLGVLTVMIVGSILVNKNILSIPTLITYITLTNYLLNPIKNILDLELSWKDAKISLNRISELYEVEEEKVIDNEIKVKGDITSNHLSYSYNRKNNILEDINIDIKKGEKILIYGSSGSGKSTLAKIISRQLEVDNNQLYIDDIDVNSHTALKKELCYVSQSETIFTDSIYNNVILDSHLNYDQFLDISKMCLIDEFVQDKLLKYDTLLEEDGFNLSGGQRQRIILARALLKNKSIYILDESLNELDIEKERIILKNIFEKLKDKTVIVISHRFNNNDLFSKKYEIVKGKCYEK